MTPTAFLMVLGIRMIVVGAGTGNPAMVREGRKLVSVLCGLMATYYDEVVGI